MEDTLVDVQGLYYNNQSILYVGEGDFSFSSSHATRFGNAHNIVATSLDSRDDLRENYGMDAIRNIENLTDRGARVIHCVNACNMAEKDGSLPLFASGRSRYDVVNYNFPHAGFFGRETDPRVIRIHQELMQKFFQNAALLLAPGGVVYVAHKCGHPYNRWNLEEIANMHGLEFMGSVPFQKSNFPGYKNRRGSGDRAGDTFELGEAAINTFAIRCTVWIDNIEEHPLQTQDKERLLLQTLSNLTSFTGGARAPSKTPLLQAIATEVAHLGKMELGPKKQQELNCLKLVFKILPLLVKTFAIHQIQQLQASSLYEETAQCWSEIQKLALKAMEEEQNIEHGEVELLHAEGEPACGLMKEGMEIYVPDDIANGVFGEEDEEAFTAFVLDTPMACSMDGLEDIHMKTDMKTNHGIEHIMSPTGLGQVNARHGYHSCHDSQSDMLGLKVFGESSVEIMEDVEDKLDGLKADSLGKRIINWVIEKTSCFGMSRN